MTAAEETRREDSQESLSSLVEELSGIFSSSPQAAAAAEDASSSSDSSAEIENTTPPVVPLQQRIAPVRGEGEDRKEEEDDELTDVQPQRSRMTMTNMAETVKAEEAQRGGTSSSPMTSKEEEGRGLTGIEREESPPVATDDDDGAHAPPLPMTTDEDATVSPTPPMPPLLSSSSYGTVVAAAPCIATDDDDCDCEEKDCEPMFEEEEKENVIRNALAPPAPTSTQTPQSPSWWWGSSAPQIVLQHHNATVAPSSYLFVWLLCLSSRPAPSGNAPFDCDLDCRWNATKLMQGRTATETTASSSSAPDRDASSSSLQLELKRPRLERAAPLVRMEGDERDDEGQAGEEEEARRSARDLPYGDAAAQAGAILGASSSDTGEDEDEKDRSDIVELLPPLLPPLPPPSVALSTLSSKPVPMESTVTSPPLPRPPSDAAWLDGDNDRRCPLHQNATTMATAPRRDENKERAAKTGPRKGRRRLLSMAPQIEAQIDGEGVIAASANGTAFLSTRQPTSPIDDDGGVSNQKKLPSYYSYYAPPPPWKLTMEGEEHEEASIVVPPPTKPLSSSSSSFLHAEEDKSNSSSFYYDNGSSSSSALPFLAADDFSNKSLLRLMKDEENESSELPRLSSRPDEDDRCTDDAALVFFGSESVLKDEVMTRPRPHQPLPGVQASIPAEGAGVVVVDLKLSPPLADDSLPEGRSFVIATTAALTFAVAAFCFVVVAVSIRKRRRRDSRDSTTCLFAPDRTSSPPPPLVPASSSGSSLSADDLTPKKNKSSVVRRLFFNDDRRESSYAKEDDDSSTSWTTATITTVTERSDYQQPVAPAVPKMIRTASSSVLRIDEDRPLAMIDNADADSVSTTPTQEVDSSCAVVETDRQHAAAMAVPMSAESIRMRCTVLFGASIANSACASARVLACASLMVDRMMLHEESMLDRMSDTVLEWIEPLLPLMNAIVNAEFVEIGNRRCSAQQQESSNDGGRVKRVSFCAYDFSSVNTPVDMQQGSHIHLEKSIDALQNVVEEIDLLSSIDEQALIGCESTEVFASVALALKEITSPEGGAAFRKACGEAMPGENQGVWPASRFAHTSELYRAEFEGIIATLEARQGGSSSDASFKSPLRAKLSTLVGSAIRFHLRRLFDLLPVEFSVPSDQRSLQESSSPVRALSILAAGIKSPDGAFRNSGNPDFNICDASVSYVLSRALRRINVFLCNLDEIREALGSVGDNNDSQDTPVALSLTKASTRCLRSKSKELDITDGDKEDILKDIHLAQMCLAAARASEFVVSLFAPDIREAVDDAGGLDRVESLARILFKFDLDVHYPEESHFALLRDTDDLLKLLELHRSELATAAQESQSFLKGIWTQFKRGGRKKKHNAHEGVIRKALLDSSKAAIFPSVSTL